MPEKATTTISVTAQTSEAPPGIGYLVLIVLMVLVGFWIPQPRKPAELNFDVTPVFPEPAVEAKSRHRDKALLKDYPLDDGGRALIADYKAHGRIDFLAKGSSQNADYQVAANRLISHAKRYTFDRGMEAYLALGVHVSDAFVQVVQELLKTADAAKLSATDWLRTHKGDPLHERYIGLAGNFLANARRWGLISANNQVAGVSTMLLKLFIRAHWLQITSEIKPVEQTMNIAELTSWWRWKLTGDRSLSRCQQLSFAGRLRAVDPSFDVYAILGALHVRHRCYWAAVAYYREALLDDPLNATYYANIEYLVGRLAKDPKRRSSPACTARCR